MRGMLKCEKGVYVYSLFLRFIKNLKVASFVLNVNAIRNAIIKSLKFSPDPLKIYDSVNNEIIRDCIEGSHAKIKNYYKRNFR